VQNQSSSGVFAVNLGYNLVYLYGSIYLF